MKPLVSIIIPAHNSEQFLSETVQSALQSAYSPIEIVIVNDASTDGTKAIAEQLANDNPNIKVLHFSENRGVSAARNYAIAHSVGKYILPLDADDLISKNYIHWAISILETRADVKMVYAHAEYFGMKRGEWNLPEFNLRKLAKRNMIYVSGIYRRKDFNKTDGYCEYIPGLEDWDFWISLLKDGGNVVKLQDVCFYYRIIQNSKRKKDYEKKREIIDILNSRHTNFFNQQLGGKLRYNRTFSFIINKFRRFFRLD